MKTLFRVPVSCTVSAVAYVMADTYDGAMSRVEAVSSVELLQLPRRRVQVSVSGAEPATLRRLAVDGWSEEPPFYPHAERRVYAGADTCAEILVEQESIAAAEREAVAP